MCNSLCMHFYSYRVTVHLCVRGWIYLYTCLRMRTCLWQASYTQLCLQGLQYSHRDLSRYICMRRVNIYACVCMCLSIYVTRFTVLKLQGTHNCCCGVYVCICMRVYIFICLHVNKYVHIHKYTCIHVYIYSCDDAFWSTHAERPCPCLCLCLCLLSLALSLALPLALHYLILKCWVTSFSSVGLPHSQVLGCILHSAGA